MIVTILFVYFAFPPIVRMLVRIDISSFTAMLVSCVLWTSANAAEIVRGGRAEPSPRARPRRPRPWGWDIFFACGW